MQATLPVDTAVRNKYVTVSRGYAPGFPNPEHFLWVESSGRMAFISLALGNVGPTENHVARGCTLEIAAGSPASRSSPTETEVCTCCLRAWRY